MILYYRASRTNTTDIFLVVCLQAITITETIVIVLQFEYQQATLEAEVENLSWKVERAEITDRGVSRGLCVTKYKKIITP